MRKILLFLLFIVNLFSYDRLFFQVTSNDLYYSVCYELTDCSSLPSTYYYIYYDGYRCSTSVHELLEGINDDCIKSLGKQASYYKQCENLGVDTIYYVTEDIINYCRSTCTWDSDVFGFICSTGVECPPGYEYNSDLEKCLPVPDCPTSEELDQMAIDKCTSLDYVSNMMCDPNTGEVSITCKSCDELYQEASEYCISHGGTLSNFSCVQNSDGSITVNPSYFNVDMCIFDTPDENITDDTNDTIVTPPDDSGDSNDTEVTPPDDSSDDSGDSNDTEVTPPDDSSDDSESEVTCPDACYRRDNPSIGDSWTQISSNPTCYKLLNIDYCDVIYCIDETGNCISGLITDNEDNNTLNIDISQITSRLDNINNNLKDIQDTLNDIKDLTPDGSYNPEPTLSDDESSIFSQFGSFVDNVSSTINSTIINLNELTELAKNSDNYSLTILESSSSVSCPLSITIYKTPITVDICSFIYPYKPLLQAFFTLIFNLSVLIGFFKVVIFRKV